MTRSTLGTELMSVFQFPGQKARKTAPDFRALALGIVKALVSIALIAFLATRLNYTQVLAYWRVLNGVWILGALGVLLLEMCVIAGVRLKLMLAYVDVRCPLTTTVQIALCGFFFEQVTIGFVGGDAIRLWLLRRADIQFGRAIGALLLDRAFGFASLVLLSLLGIHALLALVDERLAKACGNRIRARIVWEPSNSNVFVTKPGAFTDLAVAAIEEVTGRKPELSTSGGTSDARFIASYCPVIEFGLVGQTMHQVDERTPVADLEKLTRIYRGVLNRYFA